MKNGDYVLTKDGKWVEAEPLKFKGGLLYELIQCIKALFCKEVKH